MAFLLQMLTFNDTTVVILKYVELVTYNVQRHSMTTLNDMTVVIFVRGRHNSCHFNFFVLMQIQ